MTSSLPRPHLTVIVLAQGEDARLAACLSSLAAQTAPSEAYEIVVATSSPTTLLRKSVAHTRAVRPDLHTRIAEADGSGSSRIRNAGLDGARGGWVTFVDAADVVAPRLVENLVASARPDTISLGAIGRLEEGRPDPRFDTPYVADLLALVDPPATLAALAAVLTVTAGKMLPLSLARAVRFRDDLQAGADRVFWLEALAAGGTGVRLAALTEDAAYLQRTPAASTDGDVTAVGAIVALQALDLHEPAHVKARELAVDDLLRDDVRPHAGAHPEQLPQIHAALRAAGVAEDRAGLPRPVAETIVFLGLTPAHDSDGALLSARIQAAPSDVTLYCSGDVESRLEALLAPAADTLASLIGAGAPADPSWPEVTALLADVLPRIDQQETANQRPYRELRSISAAPLEHLTAACVKIGRPAARWTAELVSAPSAPSVPGRATQVEADALFQLLAAGLVEAGYPLDELPERLDELVELTTLGLADAVVFETSEQAADVLGRCPVPEVAARARTVLRVSQAPSEIVKLVVWDLDETFWEGTLAEDGEVRIPEENIHALKELTGRGIVSSICSKNHHDAALAVLAAHGLSDYFVFPRIAFVPKGEAVKQLIADMGLRAANVLFLDDNPGNLAEVAFYNPGIRTLDAQDLPGLLLLPGIEGKPDPDHTRLGHYRLLEDRHGAQAAASSNEEFLRSSGLRVQLRPARPEDAERIHDMIMRTNQLNFTKRRSSLEEVGALLADPAARSATVRVQDDFGDYGIVGWYYLRDGVLEHFLFSCRTINLGIEQHVYAYLGHPRLTVVGETAAEVSATDQLRDYIALEEVEEPTTAAPSTGGPSAVLPDEAQLSIFVLSACDLFQAVGRLALPMVDMTFECNTFRGRQRGVNTGTDYLRSCLEMGREDQAFCRENFLNYQGATAFATKIFERPYDYVVLGIHDDLTFGQYRHKQRRDLVVQLDLDLRERLRHTGATDEWAPLIDGHDAGEQEPGATWLREEFDDEGLITPERLQENLAWIVERLHPGTQLLLATAPEMPYFRAAAADFSLLRERAVVLNRAVREFCASEPRAHVVEMNDVVFERAHVTDYVMHLTAERGHALAQLILEQIAAHPSEVTDRRSVLGIGARPVALWDINPRRAGAVERVMRGAGIAPDVVLGDGRAVADGTTFVLAVCDEGDERIGTALRREGRMPGTDFRVARPWVFSPDWQEAPA
jgi:FkbH-like protein